MFAGLAHRYAYNRTQKTFLATNLAIARTHWTRLVGLLATSKKKFTPGNGLWIIPCHGVHTVAMRYAIDLVYLDDHNTIVYQEESVRPWRITPFRIEAASVLELPVHTIYNTGTKQGDEIEIDVAVLQGHITKALPVAPFEPMKIGSGTSHLTAAFSMPGVLSGDYPAHSGKYASTSIVSRRIDCHNS